MAQTTLHLFPSNPVFLQNPINSPREGESGCTSCRVYENILKFKKGEKVPIEYVGVGGFNQDVYMEVKKDEEEPL
jgi:hypothetical protein